MLNKLEELYIAANVRWNHFINDEQGLSGIVVAVLLIVISVVVVFAIYAALNGLLEEWWGEVTGKQFKEPDLPS